MNSVSFFLLFIHSLFLCFIVFAIYIFRIKYCVTFEYSNNIMSVILIKINTMYCINSVTPVICVREIKWNYTHVCVDWNQSNFMSILNGFLHLPDVINRQINMVFLILHSYDLVFQCYKNNNLNKNQSYYVHVKRRKRWRKTNRKLSILFTGNDVLKMIRKPTTKFIVEYKK